MEETNKCWKEQASKSSKNDPRGKQIDNATAECI
jgi:hypothetical protein